MILVAGASLAAGVLTTLSPCVLPLLPVIIGSVRQSHRFAPAAVAAGLAVSFALLGVVAGAGGTFLGISPDNMRILSACFLILAGMAMIVPWLQEVISRALTPLAAKMSQLSYKLPTTGLVPQFFLGALLGVIWSPCSGATLGSAVALAANKHWVESFGLMFLFGLGASIPLLLISYGAKGLFMKEKNRILKHALFLKRIAGAGFAIAGLLIITGLDKTLEASFINIAPDWLVNVTVLL